MKLSYSLVSDELPTGRPKIIHGQGVVGRAAWEDLGDHDYTGLFDGYNDLVLLRFSLGNLPFSGDVLPGLVPSVGLKFPRDEKPSGNIVAQIGFDPARSYNFFASDFKTQFSVSKNECNQETIMRKLIEASQQVGAIGFKDFASIG